MLVPRSCSSDHRGVAAGRAGDRPARMRGAAGLVEAGDRHPVLRPARRRAAAPRSAAASGSRRGTSRGSCARSARSMSSGALTSMSRITPSPKFGATACSRASWRRACDSLRVLEAVRLRRQELDGVAALGRARRVVERRRGDQDPRRLLDVAAVAPARGRTRSRPRGSPPARPTPRVRHSFVEREEPRRLGGGHVDAHGRHADVERVDAVAEVVAATARRAPSRSGA